MKPRDPRELKYLSPPANMKPRDPELEYFVPPASIKPRDPEFEYLVPPANNLEKKRA